MIWINQKITSKLQNCGHACVKSFWTTQMKFLAKTYLVVRQVQDVDVGDVGEGGVADGGDPVAGQPEAVEAAEAGEVVVPHLGDGVVAQVEGLELGDQGAQELGDPGEPVGVHRQVRQLSHWFVAEILIMLAIILAFHGKLY